MNPTITCKFLCLDRRARRPGVHSDVRETRHAHEIPPRGSRSIPRADTSQMKRWLLAINQRPRPSCRSP
jgi:hypothetical protein